MRRRWTEPIRKYAPAVNTARGVPDNPAETRGRTAVALVVSSTFGVQFLALASGVITARMLGVEGRGLVALAFALGVLGTQLTWGSSLPIAIAKNLAERGVTARDGLGPIARRRWALLLGPCVLAGILMLVLRGGSPNDQRYALAAVVFVMTMQTIIHRLMISCLQGESGNVTRMAVVAIAPQLLFATVLVTAFASGWDWGTIEVLSAMVATTAIALVAGSFTLRRPSGRPEDRLSEHQLWNDTRKTYLSSVRPVDGIGLDRILVGALLGASPLGLYAVGTAVATVCGSITAGLSLIVLPRVARQNHAPERQRAMVKRWLVLTAAMVAAVVLVMEAVLAPLIRLAFGEPFVGAIECARWLIVADGLLGFRKVLIAVLQGQGRGGVASWVEFAVTPVLLIGLVIADLEDSLVLVGVTMATVGALACIALGWAVVRGLPGPGASTGVAASADAGVEPS